MTLKWSFPNSVSFNRKQASDASKRRGQFSKLRAAMAVGLCAIAMLSTPMAFAQSCAAGHETPMPKRYSEADEALHLDRFAALMESFRTQVGLASYDPLVAVPGAPDGGLLAAISAAGTIAPDAIAQAEA